MSVRVSAWLQPVTLLLKTAGAASHHEQQLQGSSRYELRLMCLGKYVFHAAVRYCESSLGSLEQQPLRHHCQVSLTVSDK